MGDANYNSSLIFIIALICPTHLGKERRFVSCWYYQSPFGVYWKEFVVTRVAVVGAARTIVFPQNPWLPIAIRTRGTGVITSVDTNGITIHRKGSFSNQSNHPCGQQWFHRSCSGRSSRSYQPVSNSENGFEGINSKYIALINFNL